MLTRHARPTHAGRTEPLAEPSLMAFMAGCSSNGCRKPRMERWRRRGWALWTFGSVHGGTDIGYLSRERADGCSLHVPGGSGCHEPVGKRTA